MTGDGPVIDLIRASSDRHLVGDKAAEDSLAVSYDAELARFGVDTTIIVPGSFTTGINHFANAGEPSDAEPVRAYDGLYGGLVEQMSATLRELSPDDADPQEVARALRRVVDTPKGQRPFRVHIDPADDGAQRVVAAPLSLMPSRSRGNLTAVLSARAV